MRLVVDTGVFSASISVRRRPQFDDHVRRLVGQQLFLAATTVAELRYGALVAAWGDPRRARLEQSIAVTTVIPVSDALVSTVAELRFACRMVGHPLADRAHSADLWIAANALHLDAGLVTGDNIFANTPCLRVLP